jgi:hypothetical protein
VHFLFQTGEFVSPRWEPIFDPPSRGLRGVKFGISFPKNSNDSFVPIFYVQNKTLLPLE